MAKYSNTKAKINEKITTNSAQAITGNVLNEVLKAMVDSLGADYQFGGLAQPGSAFTAGEQPVVFLATTPGTYTNFGGSVMADGEVALLVWSGTAWSKQTPDIATRTEVSQLGKYEDSNDYLYAMVDKEGKLLWAVKQDGDIVFGVGIPSEIKKSISQVQFNLDEFILAVKEVCRFEQNEDYLKVEVDAEGKIIEAITKTGKKIFFGGAELKDNADIISAKIYEIPNETYMEVKTDEAGRLIEGVTKDGKKHISDFDDPTKGIIRDIASGGDNIIEIPNLDSQFSSPIPVVITGVKGDPGAKYEFTLPLSGKEWIVRFKFRITENLLNQEKSADIAILGNAKVTAHAIPLTQHYESGTYNGVSYSDKWPTVDGGIALNSITKNTLVENRNIGKQAFSVRYVGNGNAVTIENDGSGIILNVDGNATTYSFTNYNDVSSLFEAMKSNADLELQYIALDMRTCDELAIFPPISMKGIVHTGVSGSSTITEQVDAAPFYLNYAVSDKWHQVEILKKGDTVYSCCDGNIKTYTAGSNELILGGECGVLFKDLVISPNNTLDTEIVNNVVISSVNPNILVLNDHGMFDGPANEATLETTEQGMSSLSPDTMEYYYSVLEKKGYLPVSIEDIAEYYSAGVPLPKRCYVSTFDDVRWNICLDNNIRCVFSRHGSKPALVMITGDSRTIMFNGASITKEQAVSVCKAAHFSIVSHTKDHRTVLQIMPSEYLDYYREDLYNADLFGMNGSILAYPGGWSNVYLHDVMEFLGFRCGLSGIPGSSGVPNYAKYNNGHNKFMIVRVNIGRTLRQDGTSFYPYTNYTDLFI